MSLKRGTYTIKNRATEWYILPSDKTTSGDKVQTKKVANQIPEEAKISVLKDDDDLYSFKSSKGLYIHPSNPDASGKRYLVWKDGRATWDVEAAGAGLWYVKRATEAYYWFDNMKIGENVILQDNTQASEIRWEFGAA